LALIPRGAEPHLPPDTSWHPVDALPTVAFGHAGAIERAHERLRGKLSYSNAAFALAPPRFTLRELADVYEAVLGYAVSPTNLGRVLGRDGLLAPTGGHRRAGATGGRPAAEFAFTRRELVVSRPLAAFKPPGE
jgi:8-oxo-dGTP diphosphatase